MYVHARAGHRTQRRRARPEAKTRRMLNATLHHRRSKTRPQFRVPDTQRAGAIVVSARVKLKEFADQELLHGKWTGIQAGPHKAFGRIYMKLGMVDGVGLLLKLADFKTDEKGALEPDELARFQQEGTEFIEVLQGSALNNTVLNSLMLTILVALLVLHAGDHAYVENAAPQRFGDVTSQPNGGAWSEATTFYFPLPPTTSHCNSQSPLHFPLPCALQVRLGHLCCARRFGYAGGDTADSVCARVRARRALHAVRERRPVAGDGLVPRSELRPPERRV